MPDVRKRQRKGVLYLRGISPHVKAQWKAFCARRGWTMQERAEILIRMDVMEEEKLARARLKSILESRKEEEE